MKALFILDSTSTQESKTVQTFMKRGLTFFVPSNVWPSSLPYMNHCDYCLRSDVGKASKTRPCNSVASLRTSFSPSFCTIKERPAMHFRARTQEVVNAKGKMFVLVHLIKIIKQTSRYSLLFLFISKF